MKIIDCELCNKSKSFIEAVDCKECYASKYFKEELSFTICPICGCKDLYRKKDFNQAIGCIIIFIGAVSNIFLMYPS